MNGGRMRILKILAVVVVVALLAVAGLSAYMGIFNNMKVEERMTGPYTYVYEQYVGDYKNTGSVFDKLYKSLQSDGIKTVRAIGIYYDDPMSVPKELLRSDCGCVLEEKDYPALPKLLEKYTVKTLPAKERVAVSFPIRNPLSYFIGSMKAYPVLMKYISEKGYKVVNAIEFYDNPNRKIEYYLEVGK